MIRLVNPVRLLQKSLPRQAIASTRFLSEKASVENKEQSPYSKYFTKYIFNPLRAQDFD